jgi:type III pantothenate kinase
MNHLRRIAVDIGNSGLRAVVLPERSTVPLATPLRINWNQSAANIQTELSAACDQAAQWISHLDLLLAQPGATQWWISSVHPPALNELKRFLSSKKGCQIEVVDYRRIPMAVEVDYPDRVGIDRLLAAYAAGHITHHRPLIVIQAGSAVTVDLLDGPEAAKMPDKLDRFLGGAILPGVPMMLRLLSGAAQMLPSVEAKELVDLPVLPGKNSQAAMLAGTSSCLVGGVQHLISRYRNQFAQNLPIVISGGDGPLLVPHLVEPVIETSHLVLSGLRLLADSH